MSKPWDAKWKIVKELGVGGQGETYEVVSTVDENIRGALKRLKNKKSEQARGRMRREVVALETLSATSASVPCVLDHNTDAYKEVGSDLFVVMSLIPGITLTEYIEKNGPLDLDTAIAFILSLSNTIKLAHDAEIIHRDLKPDNIIVRNHGEFDLVIVDYGLSFNLTDDGLTMANESFKNSFLSLPENNTHTGDRRDSRSDLTALCAVFHYCLTGKTPGHLLDSESKAPHRRDGGMREELKKDNRFHDLMRFLDRNFSQNISNRTGTIDEIRDALLRLQDPSSQDKQDSEALAQSLSKQIILVDRKSQIQSLAKQTAQITQYIESEFRKKKKLGIFRIRSNTGRLYQRIPPPGMDLVKTPELHFKMGVDNHNFVRLISFSIVAVDMRSTLLAYSWDSGDEESQNREDVIPATWAWWDDDPTQAFPAITDEITRWVNAAMISLTEQVMKILKPDGNP